MIVITKWQVELAVTNSAEEFTSYGGLEMRMIVHDFKVKINDEIKMSKYPANLYRDDEVKMIIQQYVREQRVSALKEALKNEADPFSEK